MKLRLNVLLRVVITALSVYSTSATYAALIRYDFQVIGNAAESEILGEGFLIYDDTVVVSSGNGWPYVGPNLLHTFRFTWNGIDYDESTANGGAAYFFPDGTPKTFLFGNDCNDVGACGATVGSTDWVMGLAFDPLQGGIFYALPDLPGYFENTVIFTGPTQVPGPPALFLFCGGLATMSSLIGKK